MHTIVALVACVLAAACVGGVHGWGLPRLSVFAAKQVKVATRTATVAALIAGAFCTMPTLPAVADLDSDFEVTSTVSTVRVVGVRDSSGSPEQSAASASKKTKTDDAQGDDSYLGSLEKEQKKQNARKKSKTERSRDLCESLGRGC